MLLVHIVLPEEQTIENVPRVSFEDEDTLSLRLETAIGVADAASPSRIAVELPGSMWMDAGGGPLCPAPSPSRCSTLCAWRCRKLSPSQRT